MFFLDMIFFKMFAYLVSYRHRFHEVAALRALMRAARPLCENGNDIKAD